MAQVSGAKGAEKVPFAKVLLGAVEDAFPAGPVPLLLVPGSPRGKDTLGRGKTTVALRTRHWASLKELCTILSAVVAEGKSMQRRIISIILVVQGSP